MTPSTEVVTSNFATLLGRQPSEVEVERLIRMKEHLGIADNDALWLILMAFEGYDAEMRRYPTLLAAESGKVLDRIRSDIRGMAETEAKRAQAALAQSVADMSSHLANDKASRSYALAMGWSVVGAAVLGALCLTAGFVLAGGNAPFWAKQSHSPALYIISAILRAPAGWLVVAVGGIAGPAVWLKRAKTAPSIGQVVGAAGIALTGVCALATLVL